MAQDILDMVVTHIANDDYNHIPENVLRERLEDLRDTSTETMLWERYADPFIDTLRYYLTEPGDPEYGEADA